MKNIKYVRGKEYKKYIKKAVDLDKIVYESKYVGDFEFYKSAHDIDEDNFIFAVDENGDLAGYLLTVSLNDKAYNNMRSGKCIDIDAIYEEDLTKITKDNLNQIYIYSLVVSPKYQGYGISKKLIKMFLDNIEFKRNKGYKIKSILADTINPKAFGNIAKYGFIPIGVSSHKSVLAEKIYAVDKNSISLKQLKTIGA